VQISQTLKQHKEMIVGCSQQLMLKQYMGD